MEKFMNAVAVKIYDSILYQISTAQLAVGERIPTETALAKEFSTNRMNAHYAVKKLEADDIVIRNKKQGTLVSPVVSTEKILDLRNLYSNSVFVLASLADAKNIHWNENAILTLEQSLRDEGYKVIHQDLPCDHESFRATFSKISETGARAVFIIPDHDEASFLLENKDLLEKSFSDIYLLNRGVGNFHQIGCHLLNLDPFDEGVMAAEHLLEKGFRQIVFAATHSTGDYFWCDERKAGAVFGIKMASHGESEISNLSLPRAELFLQLYKLITESSEKIAIIAQHDRLAIAIIEYLENAGLKLAEDFGLIGFDNSAAGRKFGLTTVSPPSDRVGEVFAEMMLQANWRKNNGIKIALKLKSSIIDRESTKLASFIDE
jgi:DNA-binding LacI/PurR family transcriptional regulator